MIYLASPYSNPDPAIRDQRYLAACRATVHLLLAGETVFSPIVYGHPLVLLGLSGDWLFWKRHDDQFLLRCHEVFVLALPGWDESEGVRHEIDLAQRLGKVVRYYPESSLPGPDVGPVSPPASQYAQLGQPAPERRVGQRVAIEKEGHELLTSYKQSYLWVYSPPAGFIGTW